MSAELEEPNRPRKTGRPKGDQTTQTQRMLQIWDELKLEKPNLNKVALLNLVADTLFGQRSNINVRRRERNKLKRTLQRHGKY